MKIEGMETALALKGGGRLSLTTQKKKGKREQEARLDVTKFTRTKRAVWVSQSFKTRAMVINKAGLLSKGR